MFLGFLGNTNTFLLPLSLGAKQQVANSLTDFEEVPSKGELKLPREIYYVIHPPKCFIHLVFFSTTIFPSFIFPILDLTSILHLTNGEFASAAAAEDVFQSFRAHKEKPTEGLYLIIITEKVSTLVEEVYK
jgi:hypothetical protein